MIEFFRDFTETATGVEGYESVRIAGETTWLLQHPPGAEQFVEYESELNRLYRNSRKSSSACTTSSASAEA